MKKLFPTFILIIITCSTTYSQVGLLSSNNKDNQRLQSDTSFLPRLTITKAVGDYKKISDTVNIKLNFNSPLLDSANSTQQYIVASTNSINNTDQTIKEVNSQINDLVESNTSLNKIIKNPKKLINAEDLKKYKNLITEQTNRITQLNDKIVELNKNKDNLQNRYDSATKKLGEQASTILLSNSLNKQLLNELTNNRYKNFANEINLLHQKNQNRATDLYKNQYNINTYWFLIDSTKEDFNRSKFMDSLSTVYSQIRMQSDANTAITKKIVDEQEKLENIRNLSESISINTPKDYKILSDQWLSLEKDTAQLSSVLNDGEKNLDNTINFYNSILKNNIKDKAPPKKDAQTKDFGAFPQLTTILGKKEVIPTLQLYGSYNQQNAAQSFEANLGISFAPTSNPDTANIYTIFIPTASKFLVHSNFTWSFLPVGTKDNDSLAKKIGLRLDVSFASKNLLYDTAKSIKTITSSLLYAKAGIELGVIPKRLSLYSNINTATVLDKVDEFQSGTGVHTKFLGYIDCGARLYFDPTPAAKVADGLFIYSNLNFIINSGDVKRVTKSNDTVIPSIQVGIVKTLGKF